MRTTQTPEREKIILSLEAIASRHFVRMKDLSQNSDAWQREYSDYSHAKFMADSMRQHYDERGDSKDGQRRY